MGGLINGGAYIGVGGGGGAYKRNKKTFRATAALIKNTVIVKQHLALFSTVIQLGGLTSGCIFSFPGRWAYKRGGGGGGVISGEGLQPEFYDMSKTRASASSRVPNTSVSNCLEP